jgi:hypothetical protein
MERPRLAGTSLRSKLQVVDKGVEQRFSAALNGLEYWALAAEVATFGCFQQPEACFGKREYAPQ